MVTDADRDQWQLSMVESLQHIEELLRQILDRVEAIERQMPEQ